MKKNSCLWIRNVRLPDGTTGDILIHRSGRREKSRILRIGIPTEADRELCSGAEAFDAGGLRISPAFVDLACRPDRAGSGNALYDETLSAVCGGFGTVLSLDADDASTIAVRRKRAESYGKCRVLCTGRLDSVRDAGQALALKEQGACALTDYGAPSPDSGKVLRAMEAAAEAGLPVIAECRDASFPDTVPAVSEELAAARSILLAREAGCRLHLTGVSTCRTLSLIRHAKDAGIPVTCDVTQMAFSCTEEELLYVGTQAKLIPPLRARSDTEAVISAIRDGTVDCVTSGHTPCTRSEKERPMQDAAPGAVGYQTLFGAGMTWLVLKNIIPLHRWLTLISDAPAEILGLEAGLREGGRADFVLFSPEEEWTVTRELLRGRSSCTPLLGVSLHGAVRRTVLNGELM